MKRFLCSRRWRRSLVIASLFLLSVSGCLVYWVGDLLSAPTNQPIGAPPPELQATEVEFESKSGSLLRGWFIPGNHKHAGVVLLHPLRSDRRVMLGRAKFLHSLGYSVLLFDLQAHGESLGNRLTFGYLEARDATAAVEYMRRVIGIEKVGAIGWFVGGAAALLASPPLSVDALVLEAVYGTLERAVANRIEMVLGKPGRLLTPLLTLQLPWRIGISAQDLRPLEQIDKISAPILIIAGTEDRRTTLQESVEIAM